MTFDRDFFTSPTGQVLLFLVVLALGVLAVRWQRRPEPAPTAPVAKPGPASVLPKTITRDGAKFTPPPPSMTPVSRAQEGRVDEDSAPASPSPAPVLPLTLFAAPVGAASPSPRPSAPYGRLIPCRTVIALESNRLETPIIGLVTEDVWHAGHLVVPAGAEVHGRAALDRDRERIGSQGSWRIVWRTQDADNGTELAVNGLVLDRDLDRATGGLGDSDGSAGLRGHVAKTRDDRELNLFAATFLATAMAALQDQRVTTGLLGEASVPAASARNAVLAGTGAVLRDYAQELREAIARDGFYLRVPAGKAFYLYVTQTLDRSQARITPATGPLTAQHP
jgi:hypothetical protein